MMRNLFTSLGEKLSGMSLFTKLALGIGLGFLVLHAVIDTDRSHDAMVTQAVGFAISTVDRARLLQELTQNQPELLGELSTADFQLSIRDQPAAIPERHDRWRHEPQLRALLDPYLVQQQLDPTQVLLHFTLRRGQPLLVLSLPLASSQWLVSEVELRPNPWQRRFLSFTRSTFLALLIVGVLLWATRRVTRFLPRFVVAAERMGRFQDPSLLPLEGPKEVRQLSEAFNAMQLKISQHERERSAMLGAFSHDIRTLVTRVALRLERLAPDGLHAEDQAKIAADLAVLTQIVDDALAYSKIGASTEAIVELDLKSLIEVVVDDLVDTHQYPIQMQPIAPLPAGSWTVSGQPVALRRAIENLLSNAVLYGESAQVQLRQSGGEVVINIVDAGLGIPEADRERVLEPYVRLESSRNRETGGTGLGLAIANAVLLRHGGSISFFADEAGFHAQASLPLVVSERQL